MENFEKNIDQFFSSESKKAEENTSFPGFEKVWDKIENRLDKTEKKSSKKVIPLWLPYTIAASVVLFFGINYLLNYNNINTVNSNSTLGENPHHNNNFDSVKIARINQSIKQNIEQNLVKENSNNNNFTQVEHKFPQTVIANSSPEKEKQILEIDSKREDENSANNDKVMMLAKSAPSPTIAQNNSNDDSIGIIETKKYKTAEVSKIAFNNKKTSEEFSATAEAPAFSDFVAINDDDFKISQKHSTELLYIIDGYVADTKFLKNYNKRKITSLNIVEGENAKKLYGNLAKKGVVVITTKGLNSQEETYLKNNSKNYNISGTGN
ncbi:hypothetical protein [Cloacibacterium sp.]|uniref:hypothetical protein n=1 Tax=Cloacibacterium sp. TaxID=1913682 RepID=UPI0039E6DC3C